MSKDKAGHEALRTAAGCLWCDGTGGAFVKLGGGVAVMCSRGRCHSVGPSAVTESAAVTAWGERQRVGYVWKTRGGG